MTFRMIICIAFLPLTISFQYFLSCLSAYHFNKKFVLQWSAAFKLKSFSVSWGIKTPYIVSFPILITEIQILNVICHMSPGHSVCLSVCDTAKVFTLHTWKCNLAIRRLSGENFYISSVKWKFVKISFSFIFVFVDLCVNVCVCM